MTFALLLALTITGHAPAAKWGGSCGTVSALPARCTAVVLYRIGHRHPLYAPGDEASPALWARDVAYAEPVQVASVGVTDGAAFEFVVPDTLEYMVKVRWRVGDAGSAEREQPCWNVVHR